MVWQEKNPRPRSWAKRARAGTQTSRNAADRSLFTTDWNKQLGITLQGKTLMLSHAQAPATAATKTTKTHDRESLHGAVVGSYAGVTPRSTQRLRHRQQPTATRDCDAIGNNPTEDKHRGKETNGKARNRQSLRARSRASVVGD